MKTRIRKIIAIGVIMATFMSVLLGCDIDKKAVDPILTQLSEKYNKTFVINSLGDRIGKDTATAYVSAEEDSSMRFVVRVNTEGNLEYEEYAYRTVCRQTENLVSDLLKKQNMNGVCYCTFSPFYNDITPGTTPQEYIRAAGTKKLHISLVLENDGNLDVQKLQEVYASLYDELNDLFIASTVCVVSQKDYANLYEHVLLETEPFGAYRLSLYGTNDPIAEVLLVMSENGFRVTEGELQTALSGEVN